MKVCTGEHKWGERISIFIQPFAYKKVCQECRAVCFETLGGDEKIIPMNSDSDKEVLLPVDVGEIPEYY